MPTENPSSRAGILVVLASVIASPLAGCSGTSSLPNARVPSAARPYASHRVTKNMLTQSVIYAFQGTTSGANPYAGLINVGGVLYGETYNGGSPSGIGNGNIFRITQAGAETTLHDFAGGSDGSHPRGSLLNVKGTLYGSTVYGGANGDGIVFKIRTSGSGYTVLHTFAGTDGALPAANLIDVNGVLYGTTYSGGANNDGTVLSITTGGKVTVLHSFTGTDGANPDAGLTYVNGMLYGTTEAGGANNDGAVFSIATSGSSYGVLHSFAGGNDGANPYAALTPVKNTLYSTTYAGGASNNGTVFQIATSGSGYKVLYSFGNGGDGANPQGQLIVLNGTLFGTTVNGGANAQGTIFEVWPSFYGSESVLYSFGGNFNGSYPAAGLTNVKGALYGTAPQDNGSDNGAIYKVLL